MVKSGITGDSERDTQRLQELAEGFKRWRESRVRGEHIPAALWDQAVQMCREHAPGRVAYRLRVALASLIRHMERADRSVPKLGALGTDFVEVLISSTPEPTAEVSRPDVPAMPELRAVLKPIASPPSPECVVEMHNAQGVKVRVQLNGLGLGQFATLCSALGGVLCGQSRSAT